VNPFPHITIDDDLPRWAWPDCLPLWGWPTIREWELAKSVSTSFRDPFARGTAPVPHTRTQRPPDGLRTPAEAAAKLGRSPRTLRAHGAAERIGAKEAAAILGVKPRKLQAMSARGAIPGAARIGRQWSYDPVKLRRYLKHREREVCQASAGRRADATGVARSSGAALKSAAGSSAGRLRQMIQQSRSRVSKQEKQGP
jgi:hypothetical protein